MRKNYPSFMLKTFITSHQAPLECALEHRLQASANSFRNTTTSSDELRRYLAFERFRPTAQEK